MSESIPHMPSIAYIIPCHNEASSIAQVIQDARLALPRARIYVCDNNSTDNTASIALMAGAEVLYEPVKGKGNAIRRLLRDVEADIYIMIDGDNTYGTQNLQAAVNYMIEQRMDLLTGNRFATHSQPAFRKGHVIGNTGFTLLFKLVFGIQTADVFSGLRILSRRLVKSFPLVSGEFEIETEMTIYATKMRFPMSDFPATIKPRVGSTSKLRTYEDGLKIIFFALRLLHREFPMRLYGSVSLLVGIIGLLLSLTIYNEYLLTGEVARQPTLIVSIFLMIVSVSLFQSGLILKEISNLKYEQRYMAYLGRG